MKPQNDTLEQLVAVFFSIELAVILGIAELFTVCQDQNS